MFWMTSPKFPKLLNTDDTSQTFWYCNKSFGLMAWKLTDRDKKLSARQKWHFYALFCIFVHIFIIYLLWNNYQKICNTLRKVQFRSLYLWTIVIKVILFSWFILSLSNSLMPSQSVMRGHIVIALTGCLLVSRWQNIYIGSNFLYFLTWDFQLGMSLPFIRTYPP